MKKYVTPSILNVEPLKRSNFVNKLIEQGIKWIHYDIMDGIFVDNTAIQIEELQRIDSNCSKHIKDVHLMVENPYEYVEKLKNHADIFTFHYEAIVDDTDKFFTWLRNNYHEIKIGLAIKPKTNSISIEKYLPYLALVLIMSVEPGKGGQEFLESTFEKITYFKNYRNRAIHNNKKIRGLEYLIQVDGGINDVTGPKCLRLGADAVVAGTFLVSDPTIDRINSILGKRYQKKSTQ